MPTSHRFRRVGRGFHPVIANVADLATVPHLDDAYWVATAAPIRSLRGDPGFYAALDTDGDGRIRSDELRAAIRWTLDTLASHDGITSGSELLVPSAIRADAPDAAALLDAAGKVAGDGQPVSLEAVRAVLAEEVARGLSAAGKVLPAAAGDDEALAAFLTHVIATTGGEPHPAGEAAASRANVDAFRAAGRAWLDWNAADVSPLGDGTAAAHTAVQTIADKVEQYLLLCDAVALDADLAGKAKVDASETDLLDPAQATALLARAPLAVPSADGTLDPTRPLNPAWRAAVIALFADAVAPALGTTTLDRSGWEALQARLAPYRDWLAARPADAAGDHSLDLLRTHVEDESLVTRTDALLEASVAGAVAVEGLQLLEKVLLFQSRLLRFANTMVAMPELMNPDTPALSELGQLVIDGRELDLSVRVIDPGRAEKFGAMSPIFTLFVMIGEKGGAWTDQIAVPVTAGERGHLVEGQWGVFFPVDGGELHAQIRKIAASPISIKEALLAPFRRIEEAIQNAADKAASAKSAAMSSQVTSTATSATDKATSSATTMVATGEQKAAAATAPAPPPAPPPAKEGGGMTGQLPLLIAGGGIALAGLAAAGAYVVDVIWSGAGSLASAVTELSFVQSLPGWLYGLVQVAALPVVLLLIVAGILLIPVLIYAIPVAFATWLRLRRRDLASLLEGAGWAINTRMYLDRKLAVRLARRPGVGAGNITR